MEVSWRREDDAVVVAFVLMVGWAVVVVAAVMVWLILFSSAAVVLSVCPSMHSVTYSSPCVCPSKLLMYPTSYVCPSRTFAYHSATHVSARCLSVIRPIQPPCDNMTHDIDIDTAKACGGNMVCRRPSPLS